MGEDEKTQDNPQGMPLPPLPPGISLPLPPPPPPPVEEVSLDEDLEILENFEETQIEEVEYSQSTDFQSHWEKRKASDPDLSVGNRESMYGHIDRIATGEVGTLLDRFSTSAPFDRSQLRICTLLPKPFANSSKGSMRVPLIVTVAPDEWSVSAIALPIPPEAPVTRAFLPSKSNIMLSHFVTILLL